MVTAAPYREQMGTRQAVTEKCLYVRSTGKINRSNTVLPGGNAGMKKCSKTPPLNQPIIQPRGWATGGVTRREN